MLHTISRDMREIDLLSQIFTHTLTYNESYELVNYSKYVKSSQYD